MIYYSSIQTKLGRIYLFEDNQKLIALDFVKDQKYLGAIKDDSRPVLQKTKQQLAEYFERKRTKFDLPLFVDGTSFQKKVWSELLKIKFNQIMTYGELAKKIELPKASRAVGSAVGKNPLPIIIPCHRIISHNNKIGGFSMDLSIKKKLLILEGHQIIEDNVV